jgi:hypothetical protein
VLRLPPSWTTGPALATQTSEGGRVCVRLARPVAPPSTAPADDEVRYRVVEITTAPEGLRSIPPLRAHLYDLGPERGWVLAGIER